MDDAFEVSAYRKKNTVSIKTVSLIVIHLVSLNHI